MESISTLGLDYFYKMVLIDFLLITEKYTIDDTKKDIEEVKKNENDTKNKYKNKTIDELLKKSLLTILAISDKNRNDPTLFESINAYISDIKDYIDSKNEGIIHALNTEEKNIYRAYGFLWSIRFILKEVELEGISLFNYKEYSHFSDFLEKFGNSKMMSKNYNKNFMEHKEKNKIDIKLVHEWIEKLTEGKLSPMRKTSKKKKKQKQNEKIGNEENKILTTIENKQNIILNITNKEEKNENSNNIIINEKEMPKNNIENLQKEKKSETNVKETEDSNDNIKNKNINQSIISISNINNNVNEIINNNNSEINIGLILKNENQNLIDLYKSINPQMSPEIEQLLNFLSPQLKDLNNKINLMNRMNLKFSEEISDLKSQYKNLNERVTKLELNQLKLYHQLNPLENINDMNK